jgi:glycosyltransferase involved in cell wall biosynthesis
MSKRILLLSNTVFSIRKFRKELIFSLIEKGYEVILSLPEMDNDLEKELGCNIIRIPYKRRSKNPIQDFLLIQHFYQLFKQVNPDLILSFTIKPNIYGSFASMMSGHKQLCTITGTGQSFTKKNWLYYSVISLYKLAFSTHQTIIFQNEFDRDFFFKTNMYTKKSIVLSGSGVNLNVFELKSYPNMDDIRFIFIGRIMRLKGFDLYLQAAKSIHQLYSNVKFNCVGFIEEKEYEHKIERAIDEGYLTFYPYQEDIRSMLEHNHCLILPSISGEGIPNSVLEANALGRPCIVSDSPGCRQVINDGYNGYLFEVNSLVSLVEKIKRFIELDHLLKIQMGINGRIQVEEHFSREKVNQDYLNIIESELI